MNEVFKILEEIKLSKGSKLKSKVFENSLNLSGFLKYIRLCFDEDIFGVGSKTFNNIMGVEKNVYEDAGECFSNFKQGNENDEINETEFFDFVETARQLSGSKLEEFLYETLKIMNGTTGKWFIRLILKKPRLGLTVKSINKILENNNIQTINKFSVQLAGSKIDLPSLTPYFKNNIEEYKNLVIKALVDYLGCGKSLVGIKMDGLRAVVKKADNIVTITSRQGKDMAGYFPEIVSKIKSINKDFELDGEIMADSFDEITKRNGCKIENQQPVSGLKYYVYDILSLNKKEVNEIQEQRTNILKIEFKEYCDEVFKIETLLKLTAEEIAEKLFLEVLVNGEEGLMIKDAQAKYIKDDRNNWQKLKLFKENTWEIIGYEYGEGKNSKKIGSLKIKNKSGTITTNVGSGLTDNQRDYFTEIKDKLIGMFCDVKYFDISKNSSSNEYSLRFPTFLKLRVDKSEADEIKTNEEK